MTYEGTRGGRRWPTAPGAAIVMQLAEGERAVGELAAALPVSRPAVSQHLKVLKDAGLVSERAEGTRRIYRLNEAGVAALRDQLDTFWKPDHGRFPGRAEHPRGGPMSRPATRGAPPRRRRRRRERAFATFTERLRRLQAARAQPARRADRRDRASSHGSVGTSSTAPRTAASAGGRGSSPTSRRTGSSSAGTSARPGSSRADPANASEVEVRFVADAPTAPGSSSSTGTSTATAPAGRRCTTASTTTQGWPLYLARYAALLAPERS